MTEIKAEVPMAEMLTYAPDLRSITGGRGDYTMEFARYEEVPAHLAQKVIAAGIGEAGGRQGVTNCSQRRRPGCGASLAPMRKELHSEPRDAVPARSAGGRF